MLDLVPAGGASGWVGQHGVKPIEGVVVEQRGPVALPDDITTMDPTGSVALAQHHLSKHGAVPGSSSRRGDPSRVQVGHDAAHGLPSKQASSDLAHDRGLRLVQQLDRSDNAALVIVNSVTAVAVRDLPVRLACLSPLEELPS